MEKQEIRSLIEALLFTSTEPLTLDHFTSVIPDVEVEVLESVLREMIDESQTTERGIVLKEVGGGFQFYSNPRWHPQIQTLFSKPLIIKLSRSALETLAIIGYKQPITLPEISEIRSCNAAGAIKTLLECNFIKVLGRKRVVGRPFLYGTTREFLLHFGLKDLSDMPQLQEFEELIGEKLSPEIFQGTGPAELEEPEVSDHNFSDSEEFRIVEVEEEPEEENAGDQAPGSNQ